MSVESVGEFDVFILYESMIFFFMNKIKDVISLLISHF